MSLLSTTCRCTVALQSLRPQTGQAGSGPLLLDAASGSGSDNEAPIATAGGNPALQRAVPHLIWKTRPAERRKAPLRRLPWRGCLVSRNHSQMAAIRLRILYPILGTILVPQNGVAAPEESCLAGCCCAEPRREMFQRSGLWQPTQQPRGRLDPGQPWQWSARAYHACSCIADSRAEGSEAARALQRLLQPWRCPRWQLLERYVCSVLLQLWPGAAAEPWLLLRKIGRECPTSC